MPVVSEKQQRAMYAALNGKSTLGIPRDVASKFLADDAAPVKGHAAGVVHVAPDGSVLLLKRAGVEGKDNYVGHWALPGGGVNEGESPVEGAHRETIEETGFDGRGPMRLLDQVRTPNNMAFHTFVRPVRKFTPKLNAEHQDHAWANLDELPGPMHPSVKGTLEKLSSGRELYDWANEDDLAQDSVHEACGGRGCAGCGGSGVSPITYAPMKPRLGMDEAAVVACLEQTLIAMAAPQLAFDRAPDGLALEREGIITTLAFDRDVDQNQSTDGFERLHVKRAPITKAAVNPYYGREIPKARELGLDPNKIYRLLRDPEEIKKAAATFHNLPLLSKHVPHSADDHDGDITVGTVGSEAEYEHPYLYNSLAVWSREGRGYVDGDQKELSSAYGYDADMTPGSYEGEPYDGVMRNMVGNHVCLVKKGRAGSDVALDEALKPQPGDTTMATKFKSMKASVAYGALTAFLKPKLAMDAQINLGGALATFEAKKFKESTPVFIKALTKSLKGKLAQDADLAGIVEGVEKLMASVEGDKTVADEDMAADPDAGDLDDTTMDGGMEAVKAYLKSKGVPDDVIAGMPGGGEQEAEDDAGPTDDMEARLNGKKPALDKDVVDEEAGKDGKDGKDKPMTVGAMDAAIRKARTDTIAQMNAVQEARKHVRPIVGEIEMAFDSAEGVYLQAFKMQGKDVAKVKGLDALQAMWDLMPAAGSKREPVIAQDQAAAKSFSDRFPGAASVRRA